MPEFGAPDSLLESGKFNNSGKHEVQISDQVTNTIILPLARLSNTTELAADTILYGYTITVTGATGFTGGDCVRIIDTVLNRFFCAWITGVDGNTLTLNTQLDAVYASGSEVITASGNMAVDGSISPVIFRLRHGSPSTNQTVDITRILISCITDSAVDLNNFGDLPVLTRGLAFRRLNGDINNVFSVRSNLDLAGICYDFNVYSASNPAQGVDGFAARLTFAGQEKFGVALRVYPDGNLEMIVQDDLTDLVTLRCFAEGHVTDG